MEVCQHHARFVSNRSRPLASRRLNLLSLLLLMSLVSNRSRPLASRRVDLTNAWLGSVKSFQSIASPSE